LINYQDHQKNTILLVLENYNENSVHYLRPVAITIVSLLSTPFKLKIKSGDLFVPEDTACQTMMITGDTILMVGAGTTKKITPFGMCIEPHDRAGKKGLAYRFKENKNPKLVQIAEFISEPALQSQAISEVISEMLML